MAKRLHERRPKWTLRTCHNSWTAAIGHTNLVTATAAPGVVVEQALEWEYHRMTTSSANNRARESRVCECVVALNARLARKQLRRAEQSASTRQTAGAAKQKATTLRLRGSDMRAPR